MTNGEYQKIYQRYEKLDLDELFDLAGAYNNYIMDFDYEEYGTPVSIYEFYDNEYQQEKETKE